MDSLSTSFMIFGLPLRWAVIIPGTLMMGLVFSGYMILADRMASGRCAVVIAALFVFINGGLGFLYSLDTLGVSNGGSVNSLQSGTWLDRLDTILYGWYQTPANHAEQSYYNLRWSNIIVDMLVPQRTFLGGWCMLLPCIYLLYDAAARAQERFPLRQTALLGVMAGGLPLLHTHSFLALGLLSAGWMVYDLCHRGKLWPWLLYGGLACILAAPQLFGFTFRHTNGDSSFVYFQCNSVNNSGGNGLRDGYLFFYIKNIGIPVILLILSLFEKNPRRRFIAAGAFHVSKPSDLIPELQGRFPIRVELQSLTVDDFRRILTEPNQSLVKQYTALLATDGVTLEFTDDGINAIAEYAHRVNQETENIGARRLHTILEKILENVAYEAPDIETKHIIVNKDFVADKLNDVVQNVDLSHYIL